MPAFPAAHGCSSEDELLGEVCMPDIHEDDREVTARAVEELFATPYRTYLERRVMTAAGWRYLAWSGRALPDDKGEVTAIVGTGRDITERKTAEIALKTSEERFELALLGANDGLFDWNLESNEIYFSPRWKSMLGYRDEELPNTLESWQATNEIAKPLPSSYSTSTISRRSTTTSVILSAISCSRQSPGVSAASSGRVICWPDLTVTSSP